MIISFDIPIRIENSTKMRSERAQFFVRETCLPCSMSTVWSQTGRYPSAAAKTRVMLTEIPLPRRHWIYHWISESSTSRSTTLRPQVATSRLVTSLEFPVLARSDT